ncbi:MAG: hypothetical protein KGL39_53370 [Patescibacteria group bacterium]|nr:hypothetical protein [Patescibacteria group bacterium]
MTETLVQPIPSSQSQNRLHNTGRTHFKPGNRANPGGRPKGLMQLVRASTKDGKELIDLALQIARGKMEGATVRDRISAMEYLTDRGFGKAVDLKMDLSPDSDFKELAKAYARELVRGDTKAPSTN